MPSEIIPGLINDSVLSQINLIAYAKILSLYSQNRLLYYYRPPYWLRAWGMRVIQSHKFLRASAISPYHPMHMPNFGQQRRPTKKLGSIKHHPTGWFLLDESYGIHFLSCTKCIPSNVSRVRWLSSSKSQTFSLSIEFDTIEGPNYYLFYFRQIFLMINWKERSLKIQIFYFRQNISCN